MKSKKEIYVKGIVQDYDKSINSINKYLFAENERLNAEIDELEEKIDKAIDYIKHYGNLYCMKNIQFKKYYQYKELLKILGDKE